jgi:hypothetical protein
VRASWGWYSAQPLYDCIRKSPNPSHTVCTSVPVPPQQICAEHAMAQCALATSSMHPHLAQNDGRPQNVDNTLRSPAPRNESIAHLFGIRHVHCVLQ